MSKTAASDRRPNTADEPLMGMPEPEPSKPEPSAGELVAAWCRGWSEQHGGQQPHRSVVRRVAGVCRNVGRDCDSIDEWNDAWRAALMAGRAGKYDVIGFLAAPVQQSRGNHYLSLAQNGSDVSSGGLLGAMLNQASEPRALGGA